MNGNDEPTTTTMTPAQAIWALLLLLPLKTKFLIRPVDGCDKWPPVASILKAKSVDNLSKNVSNDDFDSLLHATSCLKVNEVTGQETFFAKKFEKTLQALGMGITVQAEKVSVGNKRSTVQTVIISSVESDRNNRCWDYESRCRSTIRNAKKGYYSAKRSADAAATSAENERNTRSRTVSESSSSDSTTAEPAPATTDNEQSTNTSGRDSPTISNDSTILQVSTELDDMPLPQPPSWAEKMIEDANKLDFSLDPRPEHNGTEEIPLLHCAILNDKYRSILAFTAMRAGYDPNAGGAERKRIIVAVRRQVFYNFGYPEPKNKDVRRTETLLNQYFAASDWDIGILTRLPIGKTRTSSKKSKVENIMILHPRLLHTVFRYAVKTIGIKASYSALAQTMTAKISHILPESPYKIDTHNLREFFLKMKGRLKRESYKPRLTDDHKVQRVSWCERLKGLACLNRRFYVCWIDEKWFYISSGRSKEKHLPAADFEEDEDVYTPAPTTRSRRFMAKVMFMGVIARPVNPMMRFLGRCRPGWMDGKIFLKRVSKMKVRKQASRHKKYVDCGLLNAMIKEGDWKNHYSDEMEMTVGDLLTIIENYYGIAVDCRLCLSYKSLRRTKMGDTLLTIEENEDELIERQIKDENGTMRALTIDDLDLSIYIKKGDEVEEDCSCDSVFMLATMDDIGKAIRNYFFWVPAATVIYLIIDNAGGHGTNDAIEQYRELLFRLYKVQLLHQVPNSPETNLLDLGVWRAMQSLVEKLSFRCRQDPNVLATTVEKAWLQFPATTIEKVYQRWLLVLDLILKDNGGNRFVESYRGKLTNDPTTVGDDEEAGAQEAMRAAIRRRRDIDGENVDDDENEDDDDESVRLTIDGDEDFMMFEGDAGGTEL